MKPKAQWISETMDSLEGIRRAGSDPLTYEKVMQRVQLPGKKTLYLQSGFVWRIAAGLTLLIGLNVLSLIYYSRSSKTAENHTKSLASEYFSYIDTLKF
jgi:hypothetical protein